MDKTIKELANLLSQYNEAYRRGEPLISDDEYDKLVEKLRGLDPNHPFLLKVEPEIFVSRQEIRHPQRMLSTEKAYNRDDLIRFVGRVQKIAAEIGVEDLRFRVTPKLDGLAGRDDGVVFATRGNGEVGYEISSAFVKGVIPIGGRGRGLGEIVIVKSYFDEHLADFFEHPRNMAVGIVASDSLNEHAVKTLEDKAVHFVPYTELPCWCGEAEELLSQLDSIKTELIEKTDYPLDGLIAEAVNEDVKAQMGATDHHYRWQIAVKEKGATGRTIVKGIVWQVGRTGNITPVIEVQPLSLSGATIKRVTGHHAGMILKMQIGKGAEIEIIRSGEVIPKLIAVHQPAEKTIIPSVCPACDSALIWNNDFLKCDNPNCISKIEQTVSHWFKTLGNADWFGIKTIQKIVRGGYDSIEKIYTLDEPALLKLGFGPVQAKNLMTALQQSRSKAVEDWRFLAAFGIADLGKGDSRKLLSLFDLETILNITAEELEKIPGFGQLTSQSIVNSINHLKPTIKNIMALGFNLQSTSAPQQQQQVQSLIAGKHIVFTGKMQRGSRENMQEQARLMGAVIQTSVSRTTDYLVCGESIHKPLAGTAKLERAKKLGVNILTETEYLSMIGT